jgi:hypothetical protein
MSNSPIKQYGGADVVSQQIKVTNTGDGLSQAMQVEPDDFAIGQKRYVVMEVEVTEIGYKRIKDTEVLVEIPKMKALGATFIDGDLVAEHLEEQAHKILVSKGEGDVDPDAIDDPD